MKQKLREKLKNSFTNKSFVKMFVKKVKIITFYFSNVVPGISQVKKQLRTLAIKYQYAHDFPDSIPKN